jgi:hypothetical protein
MSVFGRSVFFAWGRGHGPRMTLKTRKGFGDYASSVLGENEKAHAGAKTQRFFWGAIPDSSGKFPLEYHGNPQLANTSCVPVFQSLFSMFLQSFLFQCFFRSEEHGFTWLGRLLPTII